MKEVSDVEILLINNNDTDSTAIIGTLQDAGLANNIVHLTTGEEGLDYIFGRGQFYNKGKRKFPRVVFLDIKVPGIAGIEVLRHIKANEITRVIPVVVFTSSTEERDIVNSYNLAVNSFVVKPPDAKQFATIIMELAVYWLHINHSPLITD
jgi:two-component system, response regulator